MAVTLKHIAKASGVSTATVSYVINDGPRPVLPATRERVQRVIAELGYQPNAAARSLMRKRTHTFGVVFPHVVEAPMDNAYFAPVLTGILDAATARRQIVMLFTGMSWEDAERSVPLFSDGRCDGFLFVAPPANSGLVARLHKNGTKVVMIGTRALELPVGAVDSDNVRGSMLITQSLIEQGHRKIAMLQGHLTSTSTPERTVGFLKAMNDAGLQVDADLVLPVGYDSKQCFETTRKVLGLPESRRPTALVCAHDSIALTAMEAAQSLGLEVPGDVSVVGFDNLSFTQQLSPPLTTVEQPLRKLSAAAASMLLDLIDGLIDKPSELLFDVHLVVRSSTSPPRRAAE
jgi:DNA-binding LacI/PurR family transcriptional regulator